MIQKVMMSYKIYILGIVFSPILLILFVMAKIIEYMLVPDPFTYWGYKECKTLNEQIIENGNSLYD